MSDLKTCFTDPGAEAPAVAELDALLARCGWFTPARILREKLTGECDPLLQITAPWRAESTLAMSPIDAGALRRLPAEEVIDRFLRERDLRIVAQEGEPEVEVTTEPRLGQEDEVVSEQLAEIYLAQGLEERAVEIYRKLSLLNPEKSVYFAELIGKIENNN